MLLCAVVTFIGGRDGVFCVVKGWLGVEALEYRIHELVCELKFTPSYFVDLHKSDANWAGGKGEKSQSYARAKAYIHEQPARDSVYLRANPKCSIAKNLITKQKTITCKVLISQHLNHTKANVPTNSLFALRSYLRFCNKSSNDAIHSVPLTQRSSGN